MMLLHKQPQKVKANSALTQLNSLLDWRRLAVWLLFLSIGMPILFSLFILISTAFSLDTNGSSLSFYAFETLLSDARFLNMLLLSLRTALISTLLALCLVFGLFLWLSRRAQFLIGHLICVPLFVIPHSSLAIACSVLLSPASLVGRIIFYLFNDQSKTDQLLNQQPLPSADFPFPNDQFGWSIILALTLKELPFLWFIAVSTFSYQQLGKLLQAAQTLGQSYFRAFIWVVLPALYRALRLPILCVLVYTLTQVEIATVLGPSQPPTLAVEMLAYFQSPEKFARNYASAAALILLLACFLVVCLAYLLEGVGKHFARASLFSVQSVAHFADRPFRAKLKENYWEIAERVILLLIQLCVGLIALFIFLAIVNLVILTFAGDWPFPNILPLNWQFTHWQSVFTDQAKILWNTLFIAICSVALALIFTLLLLELKFVKDEFAKNELSKEKFTEEWRSKEVLSQTARSTVLSRVLQIEQLIMMLPLVLPAIGLLFGLVWLIRAVNLPLSIFTVIFGHMIFILPYSYLSLKGHFEQFDKRYLQVGLTLGRSPLIVWWKIKLGSLRVPIIVTLLLGLLISFTQYLPTLLLGGGAVASLTTEAVIASQGGSRRLMSAYALLQTLLSATVFMIGFLWVIRRMHRTKKLNIIKL